MMHANVERIMAGDFEAGADKGHREHAVPQMAAHDDRSDRWFLPVLMTSIAILAVGIGLVAPW